MLKRNLFLAGLALSSPAFAQLQNAGSNAGNIAVSGATNAATGIVSGVANQLTSGLLGGSSQQTPPPTIQVDGSPAPIGCDAAEDAMAKAQQQLARQQAVNHYHAATTITGDLGAMNCLSNIMLTLGALNPEVPGVSAILNMITSQLEKAVCAIAQAEWSAVTSEALSAGESYVAQSVGSATGSSQAGGVAASAVGQAGGSMLHSTGAGGQTYMLGDPTGGAAADANGASVRASPGAGNAANMIFGNQPSTGGSN